MTTYSATFVNGKICGSVYSGNNKAALLRKVRALAAESRLADYPSAFGVWLNDAERSYDCTQVFFGVIDVKGRVRYTVFNGVNRF